MGNTVCQTDDTAESGKKWKFAQKVFNTLSTSAAIAVAAFALIFVFLIGTNTVISTGGESMAVGNNYLYYFFGDGYKALGEMLENIEEFSSIYSASMYLPLIFGTVFAAGTLVSVTVLSILAIVRCGLSLAGKSAKSGENLAVASFLTFVAGSVLIYSLQNYTASTFAVSAIISIKSGLNAPTVAGIVTCSAFCVLYLGFALAANGKEFLKRDYAVKTALSLASIVLLAVVMGIAAVPVYKSETDMSMTGSVGLMGVFNAMFSEIFQSPIGIGVLSEIGASCITIEAAEAIDNAAVVVSLSVISYALLATTVVMGVVAISKNCSQASGKDTSGKLKFSIVFAALAIVFFVLTVVNGNEYLYAEDLIAGESVEEKIFYGMPIAILIVSVLQLAVSSVQFALECKYAAANAPQTEETTEENVEEIAEETAE